MIMNAIFLTLFFLQTQPTNKTAQANQSSQKTQTEMAAQMGDNSKSVMIIDPQARAADYEAAFNLLKQEKSTAKVVFHLADGQKISNVIDMKMMPNNTIVIFRYSTPQGIRFQAVEIEDIDSIMHQ